MTLAQTLPRMQTAKPAVLPPKLYLNGFPKSGLHLSERMTRVILDPVVPADNWYGTNAWQTERHDLENAAVAFGAMRPGHYLKGHIGHLRAMAALLRGLEIGMVFIYRDLRDVVVSKAHHIMNADGVRLFHPGREEYQKLGGLEEIMIAVIEGIPGYDGIFEMWETFAPWLDEDWVLPMPFEEMRLKAERATTNLFEYCYGLGLSAAGQKESFLDKTVKQQVIRSMLTQMKRTRASVTFRKGKTKQWKWEFTQRVTDCFKEHDPGWLVRLGYEKDGDW